LIASGFGHDHYQKDYFLELGYPWENKATWDKISPFYRIANITTPTLSWRRHRLERSIIGSEQMYQALKSLGRTAELVVYPGEIPRLHHALAPQRPPRAQPRLVRSLRQSRRHPRPSTRARAGGRTRCQTRRLTIVCYFLHPYVGAQHRCALFLFSAPLRALCVLRDPMCMFFAFLFFTLLQSYYRANLHPVRGGTTCGIRFQSSQPYP